MGKKLAERTRMMPIAALTEQQADNIFMFAKTLREYKDRIFSLQVDTIHGQSPGYAHLLCMGDKDAGILLELWKIFLHKDDCDCAIHKSTIHICYNHIFYIREVCKELKIPIHLMLRSGEEQL